MAELYAKPFETIETGYNPQGGQQGGQQSEMESYLSSLPPEERQAAIQRINAPLSGEELASMAASGQKMPTLEEYAEIEKWHKTQEISFFDGLGKIAEGGEQVMADLSKAFGAMFDSPSDVASKMPATAVEAFSQGTRNFYGMLAESQNTDSVLFRVKDFLNGTGTIEDRYNQYISALKFNKDSAELMEGKQTLVMDKDMINHEVTQAMAYIADPTLFIPFGKVASTGLRAVGLGERLTMAGAKATAIKNGIIGNTIKWGVGQPLEFLGGAVRNTIDYGLEKGGQAFEATTGISGKEFAQTARMSGIGFSASGIAGYAVPYASTISDAYIAGSSAKGFGEALTLVGQTINKGKFGRGINSWAAEALDQANKSGVALSPHAKGLLNVLNAVDPLFGYAGAVIEGSSQGIVIGGGLGYLSGGEEGMYQGIGAGMALGGVGGLAGKAVADVTGGTAVARRAVQAKMVIEGHKAINPEKAMFFEGMQKATEARGNDVDLVNGIIAGIDNVAPHFEFHALTPEDFAIEGIKKGYNPETGKFIEFSALETEFGGDRPSKSKAMYILRSVGGDFVGDSKSFLTALKRASAKDSANPNKPAGNIPSNLRKYIDVAKTFEKLSKTQQDAILKEIDGQGEVATRLGGKTKLREHYDALTWSEAWTDSLVKKFESDREGARKDIVDMLAQETKKNGQLTSKGRALTDKLRAEGFLDRDGKLLRERNLLQADMKLGEFAMSKGAVIARESDGKTHMYINLNRMGDETFPHELYHTIMRESPMKKHFTDSVVQKLLGVFDADGNLVREGEVNLDQTRKFIQKYIDLTSRNDDGTLNVKKADETMKLVNEAIEEYRSTGKNKKISDKARGLLEHYTEEFGAYYFSHWLMGRNRNTLFFGGELKGIEGVVERTKDAFLDFWQSKVSKANPTFDFAKGLNASFDRSEGLGRISSMDYFMRDMVRAASNANREFFRPDSMSIENLRDFERSNGIRNLTGVDNNRRLNPREQVTQNIRLGKEAYKILTGLDKNLRTSKDVVDENGKKVITGRFSEAELDALVKGGIVPRAWADKVNQGYAMLDGTVSNIFSAGYLGKTEQTTDASYPRLTGKDVSFKNRKAVLFGIDTKVNADGTFYTLFHTLDLAVIEQRGNHLWQNTDYKNLWNGDRSSMEADFFRYISNASKASTDPNKLDSAALLEKGDGLGAKRRDVLQQMAGMALQTGDAYKHQPIAVIPEGIRHSVTTFNVDGLTMPKVESGSRYDIDMGNAHKFIRENWQPDDMVQEKTNNGVIMTHESGFKFSNINGKTTAYTSAGRKIGTFDSIKQATEAAKREYHKVYDNIENGVRESIAEQDKIATKFQPLDENERAEAIRIGDVFELPSMKAFVGDRTLLRQTRDEHIYQRALEAIENPEQLLAYAERISADNLKIGLEYQRMTNEWDALNTRYEDSKSAFRDDHDLRLGKLRKKYKIPDDFEEWISYQKDEGKWNPPESNFGSFSPEYKKYKSEAFARYEADAKSAYSKFFADPEYIAQMDLYNKWQESVKKDTKFVLDEFDKIQEFKKKNKEAIENPISMALDTLGQYSTTETTIAEKAEMFAKYVEANANQKDYSGLLEALFAGEYDDKIQTGKPFVAVTTHGTGNVELMMSRLFAADKLGSHYDIPSSRMGSFSAGSQNTSKAYARKPQVVDRSPAGRFKRLTSFLNEEGMTDKTTEQYKLTQNFIDLYRGHLESLGYDEGTVDTLWRGFLHERNPFNTSLALERFPQKVVDAWRELVKKDNEGLPPPVPDRQMQLRKVIRMDNPYVVVDPRSYEEHYISPHMKRAMEAGHDGIIFKRFADGGQRDNVYVVFKDYMKDNIKPIDTSFDDVNVPRGKDESGRVLKTGRELRLDFQPDEGDIYSGGRTYNQNGKKWKTGFIGLWAEENPERLKGYNIEFFQKEAGAYRIRLQDNSVKGRTVDVGHITAVVSGDTATISSKIANEYQGNKLSYALYSEMAERLRAMGIRRVDGQIVNKDGVPIRVRERIIGDTRDYFSGKPIDQAEGARRIREKQKMVGSMGGVDVYNELYQNARYQPAEGNSVGKAQYEIDQQIVDRLKKSFKFPAKLLTVKDMLQFIIDNDGQMSPLAKEMISSLDDHGLRALIKQQTTTLGSSQKGIKGGTYHSFHPAHNSAFMVLERNLERRKKYNNISYEYLMMEEMLHSLTIAKSPEPIKHGSTIEDTLKNVEHFLRNKEKYSEQYDADWKEMRGYSEEWFTIADAYKKVYDQFATGKYLDGSEMTKFEKNTIAYRLSNIGEFTVGITQTKSVQKILSQIKVPKKETGLLSNVLNAIKKIWGFGDEVIGSLLEHTSDAMEKVIKRPKSWSEQYDSGRFRERSKQYFDGMPKFQPAEGGRTYTDKQFNEEFIGRFAEKNPDISSKFLIRIKENDGGTMEDWQYKMVIYDKDTKKAVARTKWQIFENDDGIAEDAAADVEILNDAYKGMKLSHLMQSERLERSRFLGAEKVRSQITNEEGIPIKNYAKTIGADKGEITSSFADRYDENGSMKYIPATMENFKQEMDLSKAHADGTWKPTVYYRADLDPNAWYQPREKIGTQSSNVKLLLEGMRSGRILRTSSYKGLGLEDSLLIAHTPDTAKIGQVTAGDKALADLQGGIFYAIANGNRIWASNFAGEGETNILVKFANHALKKNEGNKTYIMLVKADNSKIFASVDGARGVSSIFKHLSDSGVMSDLKYVKALKDSAKKHLNLTGLDGLGKDELFSKIDDAILNSEANKISFERRAKFSRSIATLLKDSGAFDSERSKKALAESFNSGFEKGFSKKEMERVFGNLMAEDIIKDVPIGHVYGAIEIVSPLAETNESNHRGYNASIVQESGEPARLIMFDKTAHATEVLNKKSGERILKKDPTRHLKDSEGNYVHETDETGELVLTKKGKPKRIVEYKGEGSYISYTGGNIPYQEVRGKKKMPFQPAEGWRDWQSERTSVGSVIKNTAGYLIMVQNGKFKVYNPAKAMIGIYDNEEQAKRRVQKDEPRQ